MSHTPGPWRIEPDGRIVEWDAKANEMALAHELAETLRANLWCMEEAHRTTTDGLLSATIAARIGNTRALLARLEGGQK